MFTLGRFTGVMGPGLIILIPVIQQMVRVDLRTRVLDVPSQDVISRDNVSVRVNAVVYYRVMRRNVPSFRWRISRARRASWRRRPCARFWANTISTRCWPSDRLNADLQRILDEQTDSWGVKVSNVELKHVDVDQRMIRVIARQAEAERARRAKIIEAEGEQQAAQKFLDAATVLSARPEAMQLRYLSTLITIANERSRTIVFPFPSDPKPLLRALTNRRFWPGSGTS